MVQSEETSLVDIVSVLGDLRDVLFQHGRFTAATHIGRAVSNLSARSAAILLDSDVRSVDD